MSEKGEWLFNWRETFEIFNLLCLSFLLPPHSPSTHPVSYPRAISHQTLDDTLEGSVPKICQVPLRAQKHSREDFSSGTRLTGSLRLITRK